MTVTSERLSEEKIGKAAPVCPTCKEPLIARELHRRFMEDDRYQSCINGHVWSLEPISATGKASTED